MKPKQRLYRVRRGDTLWDIARQMYGDPTLWPEIGRSNGLKDPHLLLVGQQLELPDVRSDPRSPTAPTKRPTTSSGLRKAPVSKRTPESKATKPPEVVARRHARPVVLPFKYELKGLPVIAVQAPGLRAELKMTGEVVFQSKKTLESVSFTQDKVVVAYKREADTKLSKLSSDAKVKWTPGSNQVQVSCGFTVKSQVAKGVWTSTSVEVIPNGVKFKVEPHPISFEYEGYLVKGNIGFEGSVTREDQRRPTPQPVQVPVTAPSPDVSKWVAIGLLVGAGVIVVATLAEDVLTLGAGIADDPISFAAAAAMAGRATMAFR